MCVPGQDKAIPGYTTNGSFNWFEDAADIMIYKVSLTEWMETWASITLTIGE